MRIHVLSLSPMSEAQKERISALGELHYHDEVLGDATMGERCGGAEILIITPRIGADIVPYLDGCRFVSVQGAGVDGLDLPRLREQGIAVSNVPEFCTDAVAEHAFALLLGVAKRLQQGPALLREGGWSSALAYSTSGLKDKTMGLFGCGKIGCRIAEIARAFGMSVRSVVGDPARPRTVPVVGFETLLTESDFIVLAAPANRATRGIFGRAAFARMRPGAILINISRASLIDQAALLDALDEGRIAGAGIDVFAPEPPPPDDPLLHHRKVLVSPHVAWGTADALERLLDLSIANAEAFVAGTPVNVVT